MLLFFLPACAIDHVHMDIPHRTVALVSKVPLVCYPTKYYSERALVLLTLSETPLSHSLLFLPKKTILVL